VVKGPPNNPVIRLRIDFAENSRVGPGKIDLLEAIRDSGSISQAARDLGMSYRRAWLLVDSFKRIFSEPVTTAQTGGRGGGGIALTKFGEGLIESYRALERDMAALAPRRLGILTAAVVRKPAPKTVSVRRSRPGRVLGH
jgi:molybdate transport system regulatory protein